jgi:hypothetical protein
MSIRRILLAAGVAAATAAVAAPAYSALPPPPTDTYTYSIGGTYGADTFEGTGSGSIVGGEPTSLTFTITGSDSFVGTYNLISASGLGSSLTEKSGSNVMTLSLFAGVDPFTLVGTNYSVYQVLGPQFGFGSLEVKVSPVPLPGAVVLFGSAVVALGGFARLRRRKAA